MRLFRPLTFFVTQGLRPILLTGAGVIAALLSAVVPARAQVNAEQVMTIGRNVLAMDDYMLAIQYFNQAIKAKPYLSDPYFFRALAKLELEDYKGAEEDCSLSIERNKFKTESYKLRGFARQYLGKDSLAIEDYNIGLGYNPQDKYFLYYKAVAQSEINDYAGADSTFNTLLRLYPRFDDGHAARGHLLALRGDTVAALEALAKAVEINPSRTQPYMLRAEIESHTGQWEEALKDMDAVIKLMPREPDLYVNRAFIRYNLDDYFGAMADYNYALELDPLDYSALFNRALLRYEVKDLNRAADDFNAVLKLKPDNLHALYNLGLVNLERGHNREALASFDRIARKYPKFYPVYYARAEALRNLGDMRAAMASVHMADNLVKGYVKNPEKNPLDRPTIQSGKSNSRDNRADASASGESETEVMERFNQLVTVSSSPHSQMSYNDRIKGRVQDRDIAVEPEPAYALTFTASPASLKSTSNYFRELDDFNQRGYLEQRIYLSPATAANSSDADYEQIFSLADSYEQATRRPDVRPADWLALGIARTMLKDYEAAILALNKAVDTNPDFAMTHIARAYARESLGDARDKSLAIADYDEAIRLNPRLVYAWFNKGNILYSLGDYTSALDCYARAIEIDPTFGEAFFNRGITYLRLGNKHLAFADLSKAGELGVIPSYNLLKRMK